MPESPGMEQADFDSTQPEKNVNMTDIKQRSLAKIHSGKAPDDAEITAQIELLFFAYRDFVSEPDEVLAQFGFGRAHHRVLHFVGHRPGLAVAELLEILRITKQSLSRVLRQLIAEGYVYQKSGAEDRRQRLLFLSDEGEAFLGRLTDPQIHRFRAAFAGFDAHARTAWHDILLRLIDEDRRAAVLSLLQGSRQP